MTETPVPVPVIPQRAPLGSLPTATVNRVTATNRGSSKKSRRTTSTINQNKENVPTTTKETPVPVPAIPVTAREITTALGAAAPASAVPATTTRTETPIPPPTVPFAAVPGNTQFVPTTVPLPVPFTGGLPYPKPNQTRKRKSTEAALADEQALANVNLDKIDVDHLPMSENCDQIRRKINRFLDSGAMTKTKFSLELGVSARSLSSFLAESGRYKGMGSAAYPAAWEYFKKREVAGIKFPTKKARTNSSKTAGAAAAAADPKNPAAQKGNAASSSAGVDISDVHLEGEENDAVLVFDTCDEVRRKINAHLKKPGVTQAQFGRDILAQLQLAKPSQIQGSQIARFRGMKGPRAGALSGVYYGAYVFFEKVRIKEGKPKSKHRLEMEKAWPKGFDRSIDDRQTFWCLPGETVVQDQYGRVNFF